MSLTGQQAKEINVLRLLDKIRTIQAKINKNYANSVEKSDIAMKNSLLDEIKNIKDDLIEAAAKKRVDLQGMYNLIRGLPESVTSKINPNAVPKINPQEMAKYGDDLVNILKDISDEVHYYTPKKDDSLTADPLFMYTVKQVAQLTNLSQVTIQRMLRRHELKGVKLVGKSGWRVMRKDLLAFIEQHRYF